MVAIGVQQWIESIPPAPDPNVNPHGPIQLVGPTMTVAITALSDAELDDFDHQLQWNLHNEHRGPVHEWLTRVRADIKRERARRLEHEPTSGRSER